MKPIITAEAFYQLIIAAPQDMNANYWQKKTIQIERYVERTSGGNSSFDGYGGYDSSQTISSVVMIDRTVISLNLAKLLEENNYANYFYPFNFEVLIKNDMVDTDACIDLFDTNQVNVSLSDIMWCFNTRDLLKQTVVGKIIQKLSKEELLQLYAQAICPTYKDLIFQCDPNCDPLRQIKNQIHTMNDKISSLESQGKQNVALFFTLPQYYNDILKTLNNNILPVQKSYCQAQFSIFTKKRIELAEKAANFTHDDLINTVDKNKAEHFYSTCIEYSNNLVKARCYLKRAMIRFHLQKHKDALADLTEYTQQIKHADRQIDYYIYKALILIAQQDFKSVQSYIYQIAKRADNFKDKIAYRKRLFALLPKEHISEVLAKLLQSTQEESKKKEIYEEEYIAYLELTAENNHADAQFMLSEILWNQNRFVAEMWLGKAAGNHHAQAQYKLANIFREGLKQENTVGYRKILMLSAKEDVDKNISDDTIILEKSGTEITAYWKEENLTKQKMLDLKNEKNILEKFLQQKEKSIVDTDEIFIHKIKSLYGCTHAIDYNFPKIKMLLKSASKTNHADSKKVLSIFYQKVSNSFNTSDPLITSDKKRKILIDAIDEHKMSDSDEPPFKFPRVKSDLDVYLGSRHPGKRVLIPDTTGQMACQVEKAFENDKDKKKRNYVAANLSIIFSNAVEKEKRTARLIRTIPITDAHLKSPVNIQTLIESGKKQYDEKTVNDDHKRIVQNALSHYKKISTELKKEDKEQFSFIALTKDKPHNPTTHKHSEYALYQYLLQEGNFSKLFDKFIQENPDVLNKGAKIYGVVLDIYTNRASCTDCKKITLSMQNDTKLLNIMRDAFTSKGYPCLTTRKTGTLQKGELYFLTRIRAGNKLKNKSDEFADTDIIPDTQDLKIINNQFFFYKIAKPELVLTDNYLLFASGTKAKRSQK